MWAFLGSLLSAVAAVPKLIDYVSMGLDWIKTALKNYADKKRIEDLKDAQSKIGTDHDQRDLEKIINGK